MNLSEFNAIMSSPLCFFCHRGSKAISRERRGRCEFHTKKCRGNLEIFISLNFVIYSRRKEKFVTDEI